MQSVASWAALWPPLTLASLAAVARGAGHEVALWDGNVPPATDAARLLDRLRGFAPALAVVNTAFPSIEGDDAFAASVRAACPGAVVAGALAQAVSPATSKAVASRVLRMVGSGGTKPAA